jgi:hypothetical protein
VQNHRIFFDLVSAERGRDYLFENIKMSHTLDQIGNGFPMVVPDGSPAGLFFRNNYFS